VTIELVSTVDQVNDHRRILVLLLRLTKRGHRSQRVHIVSPLHNLAVLDSNDREDGVAVARRKCQQCFATIKLLWPSRENISNIAVSTRPISGQ
jgi:hypothetical protein